MKTLTIISNDEDCFGIKRVATETRYIDQASMYTGGASLCGARGCGALCSCVSSSYYEKMFFEARVRVIGLCTFVVVASQGAATTFASGRIKKSAARRAAPAF